MIGIFYMIRMRDNEGRVSFSELFEILHSGHIRTFNFCKEYCDRLIVTCSIADSLLHKHKWTCPIDTQRKQKVSPSESPSSRLCSKVDDPFSKANAEDLNIDVFICGMNT